jgi:hypothetical protein
MPRIENHAAAPASNCSGVGRNVDGISRKRESRYVRFDTIGFFNMCNILTLSGHRNGWPRLALAVPSLAQSVGRVTDPTGPQFGDVGVNH